MALLLNTYLRLLCGLQRANTALRLNLTASDFLQLTRNRKLTTVMESAFFNSALFFFFFFFFSKRLICSSSVIDIKLIVSNVIEMKKENKKIKVTWYQILLSLILCNKYIVGKEKNEMIKN